MQVHVVEAAGDRESHLEVAATATHVPVGGRSRRLWPKSLTENTPSVQLLVGESGGPRSNGRLVVWAD